MSSNDSCSDSEDDSNIVAQSGANCVETDYRFNVLSVEQITAHMLNTIKEVNSVVQVCFGVYSFVVNGFLFLTFWYSFHQPLFAFCWITLNGTKRNYMNDTTKVMIKRSCSVMLILSTPILYQPTMLLVRAFQFCALFALLIILPR